VVAGFLAVLAIVGSLLSLVWHPFRLNPFAVLLALIAVGMSPKDARLPLIALAVASICFVVGLTIAVTTNNPLF